MLNSPPPRQSRNSCKVCHTYQCFSRKTDSCLMVTAAGFNPAKSDSPLTSPSV